MHSRYKYVLIAFLIIVLLTTGLGLGEYLGLSIPGYLRLDRGLYNLFSPVVEFTAYLYNTITSYVFVIFNLNHIVSENRELNREVGRLQDRIHRLEASLQQNKRLEEFTDFLDAFKEFVDYEVTGALVIAKAPTNQEDILIINRGSKDGLEENMPVITYNGSLVGQISQVGVSTSQVIPVYNPRFAAGGIVERSRVLGLISGQTGQKKYNIMENIDPEADIEYGDHILTSGLSENYPKYLPVGRVVKVEEDNYGLTQKAEIQLYAGQYTLEEVLVITNF